MTYDAESIEKLLLQDKIDYNTLRTISRQEGGFLTNSLRNRVWPKLLNLNRYELVDYRVYLDPHRDDSQVKCDVDRSLWSFKHTSLWADNHRENRRSVLSNVIMSVLCRHSELYYYQGFHDLVSVFLLVQEEDHLAFAMAEIVSLHFLKDCMQKDFVVISKLTPLLFNIVASANRELHSYLLRSGMEPFFAISWIITWFAHDIKEINTVARIYDAMLCSHPSFSLYLSAAYLLHLKDDILKEECDFATLHNFLVHAPEVMGVPFEILLPIADSLMVALPPSQLQRFVTDPAALSLIQDQKVVMLQNRTYHSKLTGRSIVADWVLMRRQHLHSLVKTGENFFATSTSDSNGTVCCQDSEGYRWGWMESFSSSDVSIFSDKTHGGTLEKDNGGASSVDGRIDMTGPPGSKSSVMFTSIMMAAAAFAANFVLLNTRSDKS